MIALAYPVVRWSLGVGSKLALLVLGTFLGSWAVVEIVRRVALLRPLFGLKVRRRQVAMFDPIN